MGFLRELLDEYAEADERRLAERRWWTLPPAYFLPWQITLVVSVIVVGVGVGLLATGRDVAGPVTMVLGCGLTASGLVRRQVRIRQGRRRGRQVRRERERVQRKTSG